MSAYESKVAGCDLCNFTEGKRHRERPEQACGPCRPQFPSFVARPQGSRSFAEFVRAWVAEHADEDHHTLRSSTACWPASFPYTKVIRLEDGLFTGLADMLAGVAAFTASQVGPNSPDVINTKLTHWAAAARRLVGHKANCKVDCSASSDAATVSALNHERRRRMYLTSDVKDGLRYPHELVDIVARVYADDIAAFNYSFEFEA